MARKANIATALNEAMDQEMHRDPAVIFMAQDIVGRKGMKGDIGSWGEMLEETKELNAKYPGRLLDAPLSETAYIGAAIGAAVCGMRPVAELMYVDLLGVCFDQILNQAAKFRYTSGGSVTTPLVIRTVFGGGFTAAAQHSQMLTPILTHIPGLKVVCPSNAYDAKGLLIQSIRDDDPVIFCEHKLLYLFETDVPEEAYTIPFGRANILRHGNDVTIVTYGMMVHRAMEAAEILEKNGIDAEVIDLRTLSPLDWDTIIKSVENTGHLVVVDEAHPRCSIATDIVAYVSQNAFKALKSAPKMVIAPHTPVPFSPVLEDLYIPSADAIVKAASSVTQKSLVA